MVCYNDESLGPCKICKEIGNFNYIENGYIVGYLCSKHKDTEENSLKLTYEKIKQMFPEWRFKLILNTQWPYIECRLNNWPHVIKIAKGKKASFGSYKSTAGIRFGVNGTLDMSLNELKNLYEMAAHVKQYLNSLT